MPSSGAWRGTSGEGRKPVSFPPQAAPTMTLPRCNDSDKSLPSPARATAPSIQPSSHLSAQAQGPRTLDHGWEGTPQDDCAHTPIGTPGTEHPVGFPESGLVCAELTTGPKPQVATCEQREEGLGRQSWDSWREGLVCPEGQLSPPSSVPPRQPSSADGVVGAHRAEAQGGHPHLQGRGGGCEWVGGVGSGQKPGRLLVPKPKLEIYCPQGDHLPFAAGGRGHAPLSLSVSPLPAQGPRRGLQAVRPLGTVHVMGQVTWPAPRPPLSVSCP